MASFKVCVQKKRSDGTYIVYIRVTHNRKAGYIKTDKLVNDKYLANGEVIDPYVMRYCMDRIIEYTERLNKVDSENWSVTEVINYLVNIDEDISFSAYARAHIYKMINRGQERNAKNYGWALDSIEEYASNKNIMFSHLTSTFINGWIGSLEKTKRAKEMYPICMRQVFREAVKEINDYDRDVIRIKTNPWPKVEIPRADTPEKRAITPEECRAFFSAPIPESKFKSPIPEFGRDIAMMILCLGGINTIDLYNLKKSDYNGGIISYERAKTKKSRVDNAYIEMRVPPIVQPLFDKYANTKDTEWLFDFHVRHSTADSFNGCVNVGIRKMCESMGIPKGERYCCYTFRHTWATVAQNDCGASIAEVGFGMNHSIYGITRGYVKLDFTPAWELNEKVVDFIFFSAEASKKVRQQVEVFERISAKNLMRGELWVNGKLLSEVEDIGFSSIDDVVDAISIPDEVGEGVMMMYKVINKDKNQTKVMQKKR